MAFFSRFTERAQRALVAAQKEASTLGRSYVGTEHLLLGVLADPGAADAVLGGVRLDDVRQEIVTLLGRGD
jgi:ATP-dependent Clp protease ATP-binding subunit ClpC